MSEEHAILQHFLAAEGRRLRECLIVTGAMKLIPAGGDPGLGGLVMLASLLFLVQLIDTYFCGCSHTYTSYVCTRSSMLAARTPYRTMV